MLMITVIVSGAGCGLLAASAILNYLCKQQLAAVRDEVAQQRESKVKHAEKLDMALARAISEGKRATGELIDNWQSRRAEILTCTKAGQPWAWDEEDLAKWAKDDAAGQTEAIKRRTLVTLVLTTIVLIALAGGCAAVYYSHYAAQQPLPSLVPNAEDLAPRDEEPPPATTVRTPANKPAPPTAPEFQPMPPSSNPQAIK
jgi:hypothetical protein